MKRLIVFTCVALIAALPILPNNSSQAQNDSDAPYLYYYSDVLNSFVIERADGSDARLFGEGLIPEDTTNIRGPGWSPSGEWFAWTSTIEINRRGGHSGYLPHVLNQDGTSLNVFGNIVHARLAWSPTEDLLMVVGLLDDLEYDNEIGITTATIRFALVDVANETTIGLHDAPAMFVYTVEGEEAFGSDQLPKIYWTPDGNSVVVETDLYDNGFPYFSATNVIFDREGNLHETNPIERLQSYNGVVTSGFAIYPNEDFTAIIIDNMVADMQTEVPLQEYYHELITWHPDHNTIFVLARTSGCESLCTITTLAWEPDATSFTIVGESIPLPSIIRGISWSPDGNSFILTDTDHHAYVGNITTGSIEPIAGVGAIDSIEWTMPYRIMIEPSEQDDVVYEYNITEQTIIHTVNIEFVYLLTPNLGMWSPDGTEFAFIDDGLVINDTGDGSVSTFRPDGRSFFSVDGGDVLWDESGEWLLLGEDAVIAGGGRVIWTSVVSRDGSIHRELGYCDSPVQAVCFGWLPANVDATQLPPAQVDPLFPTPFRTLHGSDWSYVLSWSPDGTQLVRGVTNFGPSGPSTLFELESGDILSNDLGVMLVSENQVEWIENEDGSYYPQIFHQLFRPWNGGDAVVGTSSDGSRVGVYHNGELSIYDTETEERLFSVERGGLGGVSFSPDNRLVAISGPYQPTQIYDGETWELLVVFNTHGTAVAFSPDGQTLAVANSWDIELYDVDDLLSYVG